MNQSPAAPSTPSPQPDLPAADEYSQELVRLERQAAEHLAGWQRAKADYLNLKKQMDKERREVAQLAQATVVLEFLPIYDNLKRAMKHIPSEHQSQEWVAGLGHIQKQFEDLLKELGIITIPTIGHPFDPTLHHAVSKVKQPGVQSGQIVAELKSGFKLGDRVLEPAQVSVAE
ncbi:MAG: nucleotide exchange factor GrpE [Candidatus Kerfeldbacteria bacterium]|nr:nucleotide exchange factor GrpE [Candidatus Kerfeldbacteria bacterium]